MLLRVSFRNVFSFYRETEFDMFHNPERKMFPHHINTKEQIPLLKHALIYGANGSGKSNFVKLMYFLQSFVTKEHFLDTVAIKNISFQLVCSNKEPVKIEIEFFTDKNYYIYGVEIRYTQKYVIDEYLRLSGLGRKEDVTIFERKGNNVTPTKDKDLSDILLKKNENSSIIALSNKYPVVKDVKNHISKVYNWFSKKLEVVSINTRTPFLINMMSENKEILNFASNLLSNLKITESLVIEETPFENWASDKKNIAELQQILKTDPITDNSGIVAYSNNRNKFNVISRKGKQVVQEFLFEQLGIDGYKKKMDISTQSDGTVRLLTLIPALYDAIKGKVVVIDEIENSMHPELIYQLLRYFFNSESNGQLICTTHLTLLQDQQNLVRPDELWKVEKENGNSMMSSFNDYKIHHLMDIRKGYEEGRYGGVPQISNIE